MFAKLFKALTTLLLITNFTYYNAAAQTPKWIKKNYRDKEFSSTLFLVGFIYDDKKPGEGIAAGIERVKLLAKAEIAQSLITDIQADHTLKTTENDTAFSQSFEMNILSEAKAEIYSMTVESYFDKSENLLYGFAFAKRADVIQYYKTNIDKYMQEIIGHIGIAQTLVTEGNIENAEKEYSKTQSYFVKIEYATDFIVLIQSAPLDIKYSQEIRKLRYDVENELEKIKQIKYNKLFILEYNYQKYYVLPDDLAGTYTWANGAVTCKNLVAFDKDDWELPSKQVLNEIFLHKDDIKKFNSTGAYWSSDEKEESAWGRQFCTNGASGFGNKEGAARVRCVRLIK